MNIKILIIEDDPFLLSLYSTKFEMENFELVSADDGLKGVEMAKQQKPDIILLDLLLPYPSLPHLIESIPNLSLMLVRACFSLSCLFSSW